MSKALKEIGLTFGDEKAEEKENESHLGHVERDSGLGTFFDLTARD